MILNLMNKETEKVGTIFYSNFYKCDCAVIQYLNDENWWFVKKSDMKMHKALKKFSEVVK